MRFSEKALSRMREAIGGDESVLADILQSFVEEADTLAIQLQHTPASLTPGAVARIAHTIKSSARDFGDDELAGLCATLEEEARKGAVQELDRRALDIAEKCRDLGKDLAIDIRDVLGTTMP